jgi:predicted ATPase/class 3 adenylate cyclase
MNMYTFLFTDIQESTDLWEREPEAMRVALARHDALLRAVASEWEGYVFKTIGDAFCIAFVDADAGLSASIAAQRALMAEPWPVTPPGIRVRMALYTGEAEVRDNDYFGPALNRVSRLRDAAHGGQILVSSTVRDALVEPADRADGVRFADMGEHILKGVPQPEHVFQVCVPDLPEEFPPLRTPSAYPNNLPAPATPFLGRSRELREVRALLERDDVRLVTLTGFGGTGKTRLALAAAEGVLHRYPQGVWFVDLAPLEAPSLVLTALVHACGMEENPTRPAHLQLEEHFRDARALLLFDNFEHLEDAADDVVALLRACRHLQVLVTSRALLQLSMEHEYNVPPLTAAESRSLFVARARQALPTFMPEPGEEMADEIETICRELEGIPLALELAAAQVRSLPLPTIRDGLRQRFALLSAKMRDLPPRHRSLRGAIDWSYDLLTSEERQTLRRIAVFSGGMTVAAAAAVCGIPESIARGLLSDLRDKSLVRMNTMEPELRFDLLESLREYGRERMRETGEEEVTHDRHRDWFLRLAEQAAEAEGRADQADWLRRLEADHDNLRAAMEGALQHSEISLALRLGVALRQFWEAHSYFREGREQLERCLDANSAADERERADIRRLCAEAHHAAGAFAWYQGDYAAAQAHQEASLALFREMADGVGTARSLSSLGDIAFAHGDYVLAADLHRQCLEVYRAHSSLHGMILESTSLGNIAYCQQQYEDARVFYEEALRLAREIGDRRSEGSAANNLGLVAVERREYAQARQYFEYNLAIRREMEDARGVAVASNNLAELALSTGDNAEARRLLRESLTRFASLGEQRSVAFSLEGFAALHAAEGEWERAAFLYSAATRLRESIDAPRPPVNAESFDRDRQNATSSIGGEAWEAAWRAAAGVALDGVIGYALSEGGLPSEG